MLLSCDLVPQDIELGANSDMLPDLIDVWDWSVINNDLKIPGFVWRNDSSEDIYQSCFACSIVAQNSHKLISLYLQSETFQSLNFFSSSE